MDNRHEQTIDLFKADLSAGDSWNYELDNGFFAACDGAIRGGSVQTEVELVSVGSLFKFLVRSVGTVTVPCDRCLGNVELRIETEDEVVAKLGELSDDALLDEWGVYDNGECVLVPETTGLLNLAHVIYELIVLSMPATVCHEPGKCDESMMTILSEHQAARSSFEDTDEDDSEAAADAGGGANGEGNGEPVLADQRWAALLKLKGDAANEKE